MRKRATKRPATAERDFDEAGTGHFHVERMHDGFLWMNLGGKTYELHSKTPIRVVEQ